MAEGPSNAHLVVDGSNIATEGRSLPSLRQLDEAVRALLAERPHETWTVVVDATFGHRIDNSEKPMYEEALAANELVTPPAGTIGRGDKFLLEVADRANATVFSNDSFQEFHGEYEWLFDDGRLIGGKPVPEVGWIFTARTPVRGPKSRMSSRAAADRRGRGSGSGSRRSRRVLSATEPLPVPSKPPPRTRRQPLSARSSADSVSSESVEDTAASPSRSGRGGRSRRGSSTSSSSASSSSSSSGSSSSSSSSVEPVNEPLPFIEFIADNGPGSVVQGEVATFTSHGAFVQVGDVRCYLALKLMGDPAPRSARDILNRGEVRDFVVHALDAPRRGIDLALPGVTAEVASSEEEGFEVPPRRPRRTRGAASRLDSPSTEGEALPAEADAADEPAEAPARKAASTRKAAAKKATTKKATTKKATTKKATTKKAAVKKATTKKAAVKKATTKKAATKKAATKKATTKKAATKKAATKKATTKKAAVKAKKAPAKKRAASEKATARRKATPRKASATKASEPEAPPDPGGANDGEASEA